jgi:hypothetical protein
MNLMDQFNKNSEFIKEPKEKEEKKKSKWGIVFLVLLLLLLLFSLFWGVSFIGRRTAFWGRAFSPGLGVGEVALENSYLFASPLSALSGGQEKIRVTIFLLDSQGRGVPGKTVFLGQNENLEVKSIQGITDNLGRAFFDVGALVPADYLIEAAVDNQVLPQRIKLNFR